MYVGGGRTKGGKRESVFSDAGGQRAFLELVCSGASPLKPPAEKNEVRQQREAEKHGKEKGARMNCFLRLRVLGCMSGSE